MDSVLKPTIQVVRYGDKYSIEKRDNGKVFYLHKPDGSQFTANFRLAAEGASRLAEQMGAAIPHHAQNAIHYWREEKATYQGGAVHKSMFGERTATDHRISGFRAL